MSKGFAKVVKPSLPQIIKELKRSVLQEFERLEYPRIKREPKHLLIDIVAIVILATLTGADNMVAVETYGKGKQKWLEAFLELPHGIPSHDTFSRVLALIDPQQMQECFLSWVKHLSDQLDLNIISIDGKTARGSYDRESGLKALHTVSAWASEHNLVLAQQTVESKSNEIEGDTRITELIGYYGSHYYPRCDGNATGYSKADY